MPVSKKDSKDQTTNAGGKRKMAALIRQAAQLTPNERNKTAETTSKPQTVAYLQASGGKNTTKKHTTKSQQSKRLLSATKECTTTVIRAQSKNNCANDKQMESQTNHN